MTAARFDASARGVCVVSVTPFTDDGRLDLDSADTLTEFYLDQGVSGITILGVMGEAPKLAPDESLTFVRRVLDVVRGRVPVIVGVSSPGIDRMADLAKAVMDAGASGVMVAPGAGLVGDEVVTRYVALAMRAIGPGVPVVYQDYPAVTGVHTSLSAFSAIVADHEQVVALKHEHFPGLDRITRIREAEAAGQRRVSILVGNGGLHLPQELARGADGAMTGFAYPDVLVRVCRLFDEGDRDAGEDLYDAYLPLLRHEYMPGLGLAVRKELLRRRGAIASAALRAPGPRLTDHDYADLDRFVARVSERAPVTA